jgi:hypothetical protein
MRSSEITRIRRDMAAITPVAWPAIGRRVERRRLPPRLPGASAQIYGNSHNAFRWQPDRPAPAGGSVVVRRLHYIQRRGAWQGSVTARCFRPVPAGRCRPYVQRSWAPARIHASCPTPPPPECGIMRRRTAPTNVEPEASLLSSTHDYVTDARKTVGSSPLPGGL